MAPDDLKPTLDRSFADDLWSEDGFVSREGWATSHGVVRAATFSSKTLAMTRSLICSSSTRFEIQSNSRLQNRIGTGLVVGSFRKFGPARNSQDA